MEFFSERLKFIQKFKDRLMLVVVLYTSKYGKYFYPVFHLYLNHKTVISNVFKYLFN